jgi:hypothetical protein
MNRASNIELCVILIEKRIADVGIPNLWLTSCRLVTFFSNKEHGAAGKFWT